MAGAAGLFGYGVGNLFKYLQESRNHRDTMELEARKQDEVERTGEANRKLHGLEDNTEDEEQPVSVYRPPSPYNKRVPIPGGEPSQEPNSTMAYPGDQTSGLIRQQPDVIQRGLLSSIPEQSNAGAEQQGLIAGPVQQQPDVIKRGMLSSLPIEAQQPAASVQSQDIPPSDATAQAEPDKQEIPASDVPAVEEPVKPRARETGQFRFNELERSKRAHEQSQVNRATALDLPASKSPESARLLSFSRAMFNQRSPGLGDSLFEGDLSGSEVEQRIPMAEKFDTLSAKYIATHLKEVKDTAAIKHMGAMEDIARSGLKTRNRAVDMRGRSIDLSQDRLDQGIHKNVLNNLAKDPLMKQRITQYQTLENALKTLIQAKVVTPQSFKEFQQSVRSNLGIKGQGGVDERSATYMNSAGITVSAIKQFLTDVPQDISSNHPFVKHMKDLANTEMSNISDQMNQRLGSLTEGHDDLYYRRPDLKSSLKKAISSYSKQFPKPSTEKPKDNVDAMSREQMIQFLKGK